VIPQHFARRLRILRKINPGCSAHIRTRFIRAYCDKHILIIRPPWGENDRAQDCDLESAQSKMRTLLHKIDQQTVQLVAKANGIDFSFLSFEGWARQDSNLGPRDYESPALTAELQAHCNR
jgi:hypothetical protein